MRVVFADTLYWIATLNADDSWRIPSATARKSLGTIRLVTTDSVLVDLLTSLGKNRPLRVLASVFVGRLLEKQETIVVPQTREIFLKGVALYEARPDKAYSLADCISMHTMTTMGMTDILTNDTHFAQEGFNVLIRSTS